MHPQNTQVKRKAHENLNVNDEQDGIKGFELIKKAFA
jgi:hypothetical protein